MHRSRWKLWFLVFAAPLVIGCATNPVTGKRQFSLVTSQQELAIGREGHGAVLKEYGAYDDPKLQAFVDSVGQALAKTSHQPELDWHFTVLDDPTVNAFAMPGGYIYITRGILAHLNSEAQLAGVLGHEIGHVTARHSAARITQQQVAGLGLGLASIFSEGFRRYSDAAQQGLGLLFLKYGRGDETQADELGVGYALKAGYDPREIPATYTMLGRVSGKSGQRLPTYLSSHPDPGDREVHTRALSSQAAAGKTGLIVRQRAYVQRLDAVVFGNDPRQGYFDGARFIHPELGFELQFPAGWKTQNSKEAVMAAEPEQKASMQLTLADAGELSPSGFVAELRRAGKITDAQGQTTTVGGAPAWVGELMVAGEAGATQTLAAGFIRFSPRHMFQVLGKSAEPGDANESRILSSARSLRPLSEDMKRRAEPDRVKVVSVAQSGTLEEVLKRLPKQAIGADELSILNNLDLAESLTRGQALKTVVAGKR